MSATRSSQSPVPSVLHEDADLVVLNKPAGLTVHGGPGVRATETLTGWLVEHYPEVQGVGENPARPGLVHRLDADTSGVMVVARTPQAFAKLKEAFKSRAVNKTYLALVEGAPTWERTTSDLSLRRGARGLFVGRHPRDVATLPADQQAEYRTAATDFRVLERLGAYTLVEAQPHTGRTHQIRVHLRALGYPIVGDSLYAPAAARARAAEQLELHRQFLHAAELALPHLRTGTPQTYTAPLPPEPARCARAR
ncbi:MAG: RluA family pseudouridine synthase [Candidatus Andersenbacteria bacterium]